MLDLFQHLIQLFCFWVSICLRWFIGLAPVSVFHVSIFMGFKLFERLRRLCRDAPWHVFAVETQCIVQQQIINCLWVFPLPCYSLMYLGDF